MTWLSIAARTLQRACRGRDARNLALAGAFLSSAASWVALAASGLFAFRITEVSVTALALMVPAAVWALHRRSFGDAECATLLLLVSALNTTAALSWESTNLRWATAMGLVITPLFTLMLTSVRWAIATAAAGVAGPVVMVASIPATPVETAVAVWIVCNVVPANVGIAMVLLRRTQSLRAQAEHAASVDHLTGLLNRRALRERWPDLLAAVRREGEHPGVLLVDVDHFKRINDTHGHDAGDAVLAALGEHLQRSVRPGALVVRLGGEEFAVVDGFADTATAVEVAERLRRRTHRIDVDAVSTVSISVGVATAAGLDPAPGDAELLGALLSRADTALYRAKTTGRDRVVLAEPRAAPSPAPADTAGRT